MIIIRYIIRCFGGQKAVDRYRKSKEEMKTFTDKQKLRVSATSG